MRCAAAAVESFSLSLVQPLTIGTETLVARSGLRLHLQGTTGQVGRGDIMPLPGYSPDDLDAARQQITGLLDRVTQEDLETLSTGHLVPSVRLGLEMAIQDLAWQEQHTARRWQGRAVALNTLVMAERSDFRTTVTSRLEAGYSAIKIKVGRQPLARDIDCVCAARDLCRDVTLRLDANGRWSLEEALAFGRAVGTEGIDYIEDPVGTWEEIQRFHAETGLSLAVDAREAADYRPAPGVTTWVLKPAVLGGITVCRDLCAAAQRAGIQVVLSSLFESTHALRFYARLAFALGLGDIPQGLDTWRWLRGGAEELTFHAGRLELA